MLTTDKIGEIVQLLESLPEPLQVEALHYLEYLKHQVAPRESQPRKRTGRGLWKGKIWMSDDFDAPLEEFEEYQS